MLRHTFLHLPGVGEATERKWWQNGILDWGAALSGPCQDAHRYWLERSRTALSDGDWRWFDRAIGNAHKWRVWGELADQSLFVDIETDGGRGAESITVIGTFDGRETRAFIAGENLQDAVDYLERYPLLVTFNGILFDMPLIRARFPYRLQHQIHLDLRYPLSRLGLKGGLKQIETWLGLPRAAETIGLNGWDAVRLWREWNCGSAEARELLLAYNAEDVQSLLPLAEWAYNRMRERLPLPVK